MTVLEQLYERVLHDLDMSSEFDDDALIGLIHKTIHFYSQEHHLSLDERTEFGKELFNAFRRLDLLQEFLEDDAITEIMINGTQNIFYEKEGKIYESERHFFSKERLKDVIQKVVSGANRIVNEYTPIVDTRLSDGSRVNVVLDPVAIDGPIVTIRKFSKTPINMEKLLKLQSINEEVISFLKILVKAKYNIFISGGTGSGKTTFLNALSEFIPSDERLVVIEDNAELNIIDIPNLVRLEARNANTEGLGEITIYQLIKTALRMRPTRIIIGEVRGEEAGALLQAINTGHSGSICTGHSNSSKDMLSRLETMVLMGMDMPLQAIRRQIASGIDIIIHLGRLRDKSRKLLEITEIKEYKNDEIILNPLYEFVEEREEKGVIYGKWEKKNPLFHQEKLLAEGYLR